MSLLQLWMFYLLNSPFRIRGLWCEKWVGVAHCRFQQVLRNCKVLSGLWIPPFCWFQRWLGLGNQSQSLASPASFGFPGSWASWSHPLPELGVTQPQATLTFGRALSESGGLSLFSCGAYPVPSAVFLPVGSPRLCHTFCPILWGGWILLPLTQLLTGVLDDEGPNAENSRALHVSFPRLLPDIHG